MISSLSMMEAKLPEGFRFHPRDEELIVGYLASKISGNCSGFSEMIMDVDLHKCEPWNLPESACVGGKEWYFYSLRDHKYASGKRTNRATVSGYWKATGKDRPIMDPHHTGRLVGMRKTLVFYLGRASNAKKTDWIMHEFRMEKSATSCSFSHEEDWVICKVFNKNREIPSEVPSKDKSHNNAGASSYPPHTDTMNVKQAELINLECWQPRQESSSSSSHIRAAEENMPQKAKTNTNAESTLDWSFLFESPFLMNDWS